MGVYIHWPYCARICPYCDFVVVRDRGRREEQAALAAAIADDLRGHAARLGPRRLVSVFFGGGTPSLMDPAWSAELVALARALWPPAPGEAVEVALEANPTGAEAGRFRAFRDAGVERLSLGVQALDDSSLAFLGRDHSAAEARAALQAAVAAFPRVSLDLIYARPGQTAAAWAAELSTAATLGADHVSPYQLTVEPGTAFDRAVRRGRWTPADPDLAADLYDVTQEVLDRAGFDAYEVSNHARGLAARSRHNLVYWRGWDYVGAGPGAHGRLTLADGGRVATAAEPRVADYISRVRVTGVGHPAPELLDARAVAEERLLMGLRTTEGVAFAELAALGLGPETARVRGALDLGLVQATDERLSATASGRLVLDRLSAELAG